MAKNKTQEDILKLIEGLSTEEQQKLIESLAQPKKKFRRKNRKVDEPKEEQPPKIERRQPRANRKKQEFVNEFEDSPLFNAHKEDVRLDKQLWANQKPTERERKPVLIKVFCKSCGKEEQVPRHLVFFSRDEQGNREEANHYCNKCCTRGR